jgi:hypothetical protein
MPDRRTPFVNGSERETLLAFLDYLREAVVLKATRLPEVDARRALVPSGTSVLGLVKHLTMVEVLWFPYPYAGDDVRVPGDHLEEGDTVASVIAAYRAAVDTSRAVVAAARISSSSARAPESRRSRCRCAGCWCT